MSIIVSHIQHLLWQHCRVSASSTVIYPFQPFTADFAPSSVEHSTAAVFTVLSRLRPSSPGRRYLAALSHREPSPQGCRSFVEASRSLQPSTGCYPFAKLPCRQSSSSSSSIVATLHLRTICFLLPLCAVASKADTIRSHCAVAASALCSHSHYVVAVPSHGQFATSSLLALFCSFRPI